MKNYYIFILTLIAGCANALHAQNSPSYFNQGDIQFDQKNYYAAAQYYNKYLSTEKNSTPRLAVYAVQKKVKGVVGNRNVHEEAVYKLAECYRLCNDYKRAEKWYAEACKFPMDSYARARYWYAVSLRANGKYTEAMETLTKFLEEYTNPDALLTDADREIENLKFIQGQLGIVKKDFTISSIKDSTHTSAYAVSIFHEDTLSFTGITHQNGVIKEGVLTEDFTNAMYVSPSGNDFVEQGTLLMKEKNNGMQEGLATFSADGKKMYFTRWYKKAGKTYSSIYVSKRVENRWGNPVMMNKEVNAQGYNAAQPFLTDDGQYLLFSSDRPGGIGKFDIWFARLDTAGEVLDVRNMGPVINTTEDEMSPYFHTINRTLVFASNGRIGMGGFDIYYSQGILGFAQWDRPINPGAPLNSSKDDLYYTSTDKLNCWNTGYISSDRNTDCCLAVFSSKQNNALLINGVVIDCDNQKPLAGATIHAMDTYNGGRQLANVVTDAQGQYHFELRNASDFQIIAEKTAYSRESKRIRLHLRAGSDTLQNEIICLSNVAAHTKEIKDELTKLSSGSTQIGNFEYQKATLNNSANTNLDSLITLMNRYPSIKVQLGGYTDGKGTVEYNLKLSQARVDACIKYLVKRGINKSRLVGKAFGKCCPLEPDTIDGKDNPAGREKNRRVEYVLLPNQ
ncbi:MAG: OmpA family protein [Chitinophagaceae bacterium]